MPARQVMADFVEFSARNVVDLSGGALSAAAQNGAQGAVLIDPASIEVNSHILRNSTSSGGTDTASLSWNAGSLTLQADDNITVASGMVVSSRRVTNASDATAHINDASIADSGDITLQSQKIIVNGGATIKQPRAQPASQQGMLPLMLIQPSLPR